MELFWCGNGAFLLEKAVSKASCANPLEKVVLGSCCRSSVHSLQNHGTLMSEDLAQKIFEYAYSAKIARFTQGTRINHLSFFVLVHMLLNLQERLKEKAI